MKIGPTVIEILAFNKWSLKVYRFQKRDVDHVVERLVEEWSSDLTMRSSVLQLLSGKLICVHV